MNHIEPMIQAHPSRTKMQVVDGLGTTLVALLDCAQTCTSCADACIAAEKTRMLMRCIRLTMDCAAICTATTAVLTRAYEPDWRVLHAQLQACMLSCATAAEECERHSREYSHSRICGDACRVC